MSASSLVKVYDGLEPELVFATAGPGVTPTLAQVLAEGASANDLAITDIASLAGSTTGLFTISGGAGEGVNVVGPVGASLVATTGGCTVEATAGALTLTSGVAQPNGLVLGGNLAPVASAGPNIIVTHIISFKSGATTYWLPVLSAAPTA